MLTTTIKYKYAVTTTTTTLSRCGIFIIYSALVTNFLLLNGTSSAFIIDHGKQSMTSLNFRVKNEDQQYLPTEDLKPTIRDRREFLSSAFRKLFVTTSGVLVGVAQCDNNNKNDVAMAVMLNVPENEKVFTVGEAFGITECKVRFKEAQSTLQYLIDNFTTISKEGGGDNIRRYLGTVGTTSALYGINKVTKELQTIATDIVEYTENKNDFEYWLGAADTAAYSSIFVEFSSAKTKPEKFYQDAKDASIRMKTYLDAMAAEIPF